MIREAMKDDPNGSRNKIITLDYPCWILESLIDLQNLFLKIQGVLNGISRYRTF